MGLVQRTYSVERATMARFYVFVIVLACDPFAAWYLLSGRWWATPFVIALIAWDMAVAYRVFSRTVFSVSLSDDGTLKVTGWPLRWTREIPVESINVISLPRTTNHFFSRSERLEIVHTEGRIPVMYRLTGLDDLVERLQRQNHSITVVRSERDSSFL